ncbi:MULTISPECIES: hypothetical protein [unclassified Pseudomonas]|uniref:hypothetical protein n=1 Tax=unclassified Pseudomonas TaxID=196821 RepID=UPI002448A113|nr:MULTISPECIES: hypothetical protein [unclassified Pseudomonas]MDG9925970.1 hypothetical protein [Pseudomonas sp. GD04045]MDH0033644.1 hypothetical protein [Pseudomonas sp. GD04019]
MKDNFESIRAERDVPSYRQTAIQSNYTGLWRQIALGIVVGYSVLGVLSAVGWVIFLKLAVGTLQINIP